MSSTSEVLFPSYLTLTLRLTFDFQSHETRFTYAIASQSSRQTVERCGTSSKLHSISNYYCHTGHCRTGHYTTGHYTTGHYTTGHQAVRDKQ